MALGEELVDEPVVFDFAVGVKRVEEVVDDVVALFAESALDDGVFLLG